LRFGHTSTPTESVCYDGSFDVIPGCVCHESCKSCGFYDNPKDVRLFFRKEGCTRRGDVGRRLPRVRRRLGRHGSLPGRHRHVRLGNGGCGAGEHVLRRRVPQSPRLPLPRDLRVLRLLRRPDRRASKRSRSEMRRGKIVGRRLHQVRRRRRRRPDLQRRHRHLRVDKTPPRGPKRRPAKAKSEKAAPHRAPPA
jgi:hypothetical protein